MSSAFLSQEEVTPSDPESSSDDETLPEITDDLGRECHGAESADLYQHRAVPVAGSTAQAHLFYGAVLEDWCYNEVIEALGRQYPSRRRLTRDDAEVQALGSDLYSSLSAQLGAHGVVGQGFEGEEWQQDRQLYRDGLKVLLNRVLNQRLASVPSSSTALSPLATPYQPGKPHGTGTRPSSPKMLTGPSNVTEDIVSIQQRLDSMQLRDYQQTMVGSPATTFPTSIPAPEQPLRQPSRYATDFAELGIIGRGGYGKVFKVVNHLDGQEYAIKKIILSRKRLRKLQDGGSTELEALLREIRTLAGFDHINVVRYFGGWIEQTGATIAKDRSQLASPTRAMLADRAAADSEEFSLGLQFGDEPDGKGSTVEDGGIVFGYSSESSKESEVAHKSRTRRASQATTTSNLTMKSFVQSTGEAEDDEIESIPRSFGFGLSMQGSTSTDDKSSQNPFSDGRPHTPRERADSDKPNEITWILHIQMSLYPLSLATYMAPNDEKSSTPYARIVDRHCFHLLPSLRLMLAILAGVEYLHSQKVVHRDLKPANIFLSVHKGTTRSPSCVDISTCPHCDSAGIDPTFIIPRIGDFGLVADINSTYAPNSHRNRSPVVSINEIAEPAAPQPYQPLKDRLIGTEFYRPPSSPTSPDEKLDVFSLGVVAFELLWKFETSMPPSLYSQSLHAALTLHRNGTALRPSGSE